MRKRKCVTLWICRDEAGADDPDALWIAVEKPVLHGCAKNSPKIWVAHSSGVARVPDLKPGQCRRVRIRKPDMGG